MVQTTCENTFLDMFEREQLNEKPDIMDKETYQANKDFLDSFTGDKVDIKI